MNAGSYNRNGTTFGFIKLGLIIASTLVGTVAERSYGQAQPLGCNNLPLCTTPILDQLPANFDQRPRLDTAGKIVDAHDGMMAQFGDHLYLYGTSYGLTDGWRGSTNDFSQPTNRYRCYSSTDLVHWTLAGNNLLKTNDNGVLKDPPAGLYFLPKVVYNASTKEYVMWYNWWDRPYGNFPCLGVAHSCSPAGPFTIVNHYALPGSHDMSLLVDDDQTAYIMYTMYTESGWPNYVQRLSSDYFSTNGPRTLVTHGEGCVFFKNRSLGKYYAVIGGACAYCPWGASSYPYECTSTTDPLAAWLQASPSDINPGRVPAQQYYVAEIPTSQGTHYLWMGDLWGTGPKWEAQDDQNGKGDRGEDQLYWANLVFDTNGHIQVLSAYTRNVVLVNRSGETWGEDGQMMAYPNGGGNPTQLGTLSGSGNVPWNDSQAWSTNLALLAINQYFNLQLQDIHNGVPTLVPEQYFFNTAAWNTFATPHQFSSTPGGSISGYVYRQSAGGYFGWYTFWDGVPTTTLTNQGPYSSTDPLQIVAYLNNSGSPIVVGSRSGSWDPQQTWKMSLSALTPGKAYTFELQDTAWGNAVLPPRSGLATVPSSGAGLGGYIFYDGIDGYWGWHTVWMQPPSNSIATLTMNNNGTQFSGDPFRIVAYLNNTGTPIVVGSMCGNWSGQQKWSVSLSALTAGSSYTFELQDTAWGNAVLPPRSALLQVPSSGAAPPGYIYFDNNGGYWGWHTVWGW